MEEQTTQWTKQKGQRDKQQSTKHYTENQRSGNMNLNKQPGVNSDAPEG